MPGKSLKDDRTVFVLFKSIKGVNIRKFSNDNICIGCIFYVVFKNRYIFDDRC